MEVPDAGLLENEEASYKECSNRLRSHSQDQRPHCDVFGAFPSPESLWTEGFSPDVLHTPKGEDLNIWRPPHRRQSVNLPPSCERVRQRRKLSNVDAIPRSSGAARSLCTVMQLLPIAVILLLLLLPAACDSLSTECQVSTQSGIAKFPSQHGLQTKPTPLADAPPHKPSDTSQLQEHIAAVERHLESVQACLAARDHGLDSPRLAATLQRAEKCKGMLEAVTRSACFDNCHHLNRENMKSCFFDAAPSDAPSSAAAAGAPFVSSVVGEPAEVLAEAMCSAAFTGDLSTIRRLVESGQASIDTCDYVKRSVLQLAVAGGQEAVVEYLLKGGADITHEDREGVSPFAAAMAGSSAAVREQLVRAKDDLERRRAGRSHSRLRLRAESEHWAVERKEVRIVRLIGEGDQGLVYRGEWRGIPVVVKMLKNQHSPEQLREFANEISVLAMLRHPNLVLFLGACLSWDPNFIVTELLEGGALIDLFQRQRAASPTGIHLPTLSQVVVWATDLARALCCLHQQAPPIIHRDVKPSNLLVTRDGHLKLSDLGLSKVMEKGGEAAPYRMTGATGTLRYMAPEVVRSEEYDAKVDVYSFGFVLWYMCTGELPLADKTQADFVQAAMSTEDLRPDLGRITCAPLAALMARCWAREPKYRPSAHDVLEELAMISPFDPDVTAATPPPPPPAS